MGLAMVGVTTSMLTCGAGRGSSRKRGFTLVELLVVLAILAIILTVAGIQVMRTLQKGRLAATVQSLQLLASRAYLEAQRRSATMFLRVGPLAGNVLPVELWADNTTNDPGNDHIGTLKTTGGFPDVLVERIALDNRQIALSTVDPGQIESAAWDENATDGTKARVLGCDVLGRAMDTSLVPPQQITQAATLSITHAEMVSGRLLPKRNYQLRISPGWGVQIAEIAY
jgi:prepilin-type N-terminal cleavage/methylation domain-containing protein